jgi:hypothetical protein
MEIVERRKRDEKALSLSPFWNGLLTRLYGNGRENLHAD